MCLMAYANNKGADQPAHPRSLISAFVVRCLDSEMSLVSVTKISSLMLASVAAQAGWSLTWSETPEDKFSHGEAQVSFCQLLVSFMGIIGKFFHKKETRDEKSSKRELAKGCCLLFIGWLRMDIRGGCECMFFFQTPPQFWSHNFLHDKSDIELGF